MQGPFSQPRKNLSYKPKKLKDYQKMIDDYEKNGKKAGGLGPNIGNKEWEYRKEKTKKMSDYVQKL